jgi:hypothetical protein
MLIHKLRAEDQKGYYAFWSWTNTDMTFSFTKGRGLMVDENVYTREPRRITYLKVVEEKGYVLVPRAVVSIVTSFNETPTSVS